MLSGSTQLFVRRMIAIGGYVLGSKKATGKFKITKVVGEHTCLEKELHTRHRQLTSTLIASRLIAILTLTYSD
jgi:hypothetical protein